MSMFLPDGFDPTGGAGGSSAPTDFGTADPQTSTDDVALMQRVLAAAAQNPSLIPASFMGYVLDWLQINKLVIPVGQVFGFKAFSNQLDTTTAGLAANTTAAAAAAAAAASAAAAAASAAAMVTATLGTSAGVSGLSGASAAGPAVSVAAGSYVVLAGMDVRSSFGGARGTLTTSGGMVVTGGPPTYASVAKASTQTLGSPGSITSTLVCDPDLNGVNTDIATPWLLAIRYSY
jgi:pyruvate/2-oxoglutarate dehydrogenase complex dihydrolipoamide acyltransferase (E2) component